MGPRYIAFRAWWELRRRMGLLKRAFPTDPPRQDYISLEAWRANPGLALLAENAHTHLPQADEATREKLAAEAERILEGQLRFFSATWHDLGNDWDWHTHPETGYRYPSNHWTAIEDLSARAGDIKYVWEKARFAWVYTLARAEAHTGQDQGGYVFGQIAHFLALNPINQGPQYRCSQEISLRLLAWSFALAYWRNHPALTDDLFGQMMHAMRWQLHHVRQAIHFSRIAVRNNHAITECAMLALAERLFPFWPESNAYATEGKAWLEAELAYQIYPGGAYLQHSHNYHRAVVQVAALILSPAGLGPDALGAVAKARLNQSLDFLLACQDQASGWLPNYGNNDGAHFFPFAATHYRDYRPALHALALALGRPSPYPSPGPWEEEAAWWSLGPATLATATPQLEDGAFVVDGYGILRHNDGQTLTCLRAAAYHDRPAQADNLHLDIWHRGRNLLRDAGTYKYNAERSTLLAFGGSAGHNTCTLEAEPHMLKGSRFIWYYWPKMAKLEASADGHTLQAQVQAYRHLHPPGITLTRTVTVEPDACTWHITDYTDNTLGKPFCQHWHTAPGWEGILSIEAVDANGHPLEPAVADGYYAGYYGRKQPAPHLTFATNTGQIRTIIRLLQPLPPALYPDQALDE